MHSRACIEKSSHRAPAGRARQAICDIAEHDRTSIWWWRIASIFDTGRPKAEMISLPPNAALRALFVVSSSSITLASTIIKIFLVYCYHHLFYAYITHDAITCTVFHAFTAKFAAISRYGPGSQFTAIFDIISHTTCFTGIV